MTSLESKAISRLRFPLMMGVVLIHCVVIEPSLARNQGLGLTAAIIQLFSLGLTGPCVPLFFFISGYLFFFKYAQRFTVADYGQQLGKRVRTLLLPYLFWNAVVLGYFAFMHAFTPSLINPSFNNVYQYSWQEWLRSFWDFPGNQPVCFQFWFLRDLMVMMVCSPLVFAMARYGKKVWGVLLVGLWLVAPHAFPYQMAITFFSLGTLFALYGWDFAKASRRVLRYALPVWIIVLIINTIQLGGGKILTSSSTLLGACVYLAGATYASERSSRWADWLASGSFFIYAFHGFPLGVIMKLTIALLHPASNTLWLLVYAGCFLAIVVLSLAFYGILQKIMPKFTFFITGGR